MACNSEDVETIVLGNVVVIRNIPGQPFADAETGEALNPTSVYLTAEDPDGVESVYEYGVDAEISRPAVGYFRAEITPDSAGEWTFSLWSEGDGKGKAYKKVLVIDP